MKYVRIREVSSHLDRKKFKIRPWQIRLEIRLKFVRNTRADEFNAAHLNSINFAIVLNEIKIRVG